MKDRDGREIGCCKTIGSRQRLELFKVQTEIAERGCRPLPSVWEGEDSELLEQMFDFYPRREPERILDATINEARFWRGSKRIVAGLDINSRYHPTVVGDNMAMPFTNESFDVVVYDHPHIPNLDPAGVEDFDVGELSQDFEARRETCWRTGCSPATSLDLEWEPQVAYSILKQSRQCYSLHPE